MRELITTDGARLAYQDTGGEGVPLVMLHGWGQTQALFRHQTEGLAPVRRVVTVDLRGHGRSGRPRHGHRIARLSRDVLPRIDVPTLVIGCEGSHVHPDSQRFVAERIPGALLHVFPSDVASSHFPFLENPAAFDAVVEKFLAEEPANAA